MFIISREEFIQVKESWASKKNHTAGEHIVYNILRGKGFKHGFIEKTKNIQGSNPWYAYSMAKCDAWNMSRFYNERFKAVFGVDKPATLEDIIKNA